MNACPSNALRRLLRPSTTGLLLTIVLCSSQGCLGPSGGGGGGCDPGSERCECYPNDTCDEGLSCRSNLCVASGNAGSEEDGGRTPPAETDETDGATDETDEETTDDEQTDSSAPDAQGTDEPTDSGETDAQTTDVTSTDAATDQATDGEDTTDIDGTETGTTDVDSTDVMTTDGMGTDVVETDVVETDVMETDVMETETTDGMETTDVVETDPPDTCVESGSCALGSGNACLDGEEIPLECGGCGVLGCGIGCCGHIGALAAQDYPFILMSEMIETFTPDDAGTYLEVIFTDDNQVAAVTFRLDETQFIDYYYLQVSASFGGDVSMASVSLEDGENGCAYELVSGLLWDQLGCWGDWELSGQGNTSQINVRMHSLDGGQAEMLVSDITW